MSYACIYMYITASMNHVKMRLSYFYKSIVKLVHNQRTFTLIVGRGGGGGGGGGGTHII